MSAQSCLPMTPTELRHQAYLLWIEECVPEYEKHGYSTRWRCLRETYRAMRDAANKLEGVK